MDTPIIRVTTQRHDMDCGVACLAMVCGVSYEDALVAIAKELPDVCAIGIWTRHLKRAADLLGFTLRATRRFDLDEDTGILNVSSPLWANDHLVVLWEGRIIDTDGGLYRSDVYVSINQIRPTILLVAEPKKAKP